MLASYITRGTPILAAQMNAAFHDFGDALSGIMGGKTFLLAFPGIVPARLLGMPFFFTDGVCYHAPKIPGAVTYTVTVTDILTGMPATGQGVRQYDQAAIDAAEAAKPVLTYGANQIAVIGDITAYPPGLSRTSGIGLCDRSLRAHIRMNAGLRYWLRETSAVFPEKIYRHALAELIIEGPAAVTVPAGKWRFFRAHNMQHRSCTLTISGVAFTLAPFECKCIVQDFDGYELLNPAQPKFKNVRESPIPYFFEWARGEEPLFWFWNSIPGGNPALPFAGLTADGPVLCASAAMQGNNVTNPAVMYDFLYAMRETGDCYARFRRDPHIHCDMGRENAPYFACLKNTPEFPDAVKGQLREDALVGDMLHHVGPVEVHRLPLSAINGILTTTFQFRGYRTLLTDLAAAGFSTLTDAAGNLRITRPDAAAYLWDLLPIGTNFLKRTGYYREQQAIPTWNNSAAWQRVPVAVPLNAIPRTIEDAIFEANVPTAGAAQIAAQDMRGHGLFTLRTRPSYRIYQRTAQITGQSNTYQIPGSPALTVTVIGDGQRTITYAGGGGGTIGGIHAVPASALLTLGYWGDPTRGSQSDDFVSYSVPSLIFTPEGWVIIFTETLVAIEMPFALDVIPAYDPILFTIPPFAYAENPSNVYRRNGSALELKHCIRLRKHGWAWSQAQKEFAFNYSMAVGRMTNPGYADAVSGPDGKDWSLPGAYTPTAVKILRSLLVTEAGSTGGIPTTNARGARFYGDTQPGDGWNSYNTTGRAKWGVGAWRPYRAQLLTTYPDGTPNSSDEPSVSPRDPTNNAVTAVPTYVPMLAEHYNMMVQAVKQLGNNVLFTRMPVVVFGQKILDFTPSTSGAFLKWETLFRNAIVAIPAPATAYAGINTAHADAPYYTRFLSDQGVSLRGAVDADYPGLAIAKTQWSNHDEPNITADLAPGTPNVSNWRMATPRFFRHEFGIEGVGVARVETMPFWGVQLSSYTTYRWVSIADMQAFSGALGFPFLHRQMIIPFKLDLLHRGDTWEPSAVISDQNAAMGGPINPPPALTVQPSFGLIDMHVGYYPTQQLLFRLAEDATEIEWKVTIPTTADIQQSGYGLRCSGQSLDAGGKIYVAYNHRGNRTFGRMQMTVGCILGFTGLLSTSWGVIKSTFIGNPQVSGAVQEFNDGNTIKTESGPRGFRVLAVEGLEQDRLAAWFRRERRWFAMQVASSFPGATVNIAAVGVADWGIRRDWWLEDRANYARSFYADGSFYPISYPSNFNPIRAIPAMGTQTYACPVGLTLLFSPDADGAARMVELGS